MKLIQLTPDIAFLTWPQMQVRRSGRTLIFSNLNGSAIEQIQSLNEHTAKECYDYLISCLGDPDSHSCDLPYREAIYFGCWNYAKTVAPLMLALQAKVKDDCGFAELKPFKDAVLPYNLYCNSDGVASHWGKLLMNFYEIQLLEDKSSK